MTILTTYTGPSVDRNAVGQTCAVVYDRIWTVKDGTLTFIAFSGVLKGYPSFISQDKNRLPTSKAMEKMRLETFSLGGGWIHDKVKNHGASSKIVSTEYSFCNTSHS